MTEYQKNAYAALLANVTESQQWCADHAQMLTADELREHINRVNRAYGLPSDLLEKAARCVEATIGISIAENS